jgi:hypothetical protein
VPAHKAYPKKVTFYNPLLDFNITLIRVHLKFGAKGEKIGEKR